MAPVARLGEFEVYDLGGGLGARYTLADEPPTVAAYLDALIGAAKRHLPPGRSSSSSRAKHGRDDDLRVTTVKRGAITFVAVDGGMGDNLEVALFRQRFEAGIVGGSTVPGWRPSPWSAGTARAATSSWTGCRWPNRTSAICSPYRPRVRTATRWRTTTTATG